MMLLPSELERITIFVAAEMARRRKEKGLKLNHPEAQALIVDELLEGAREGRSLSDLIGYGSTILTTDDVMDGVRYLVRVVQVEGMFPDGSKLITVHDPIRPGALADVSEVQPGEVLLDDSTILINEGRTRVNLTVQNTGDRPIQVGSHFHFFEVNKALVFDRTNAFGMRLDVPSGSAKRFEPGELKEVSLVQIGGLGIVGGFNTLTNGSIHDSAVRTEALARGRSQGFLDTGHRHG